MAFQVIYDSKRSGHFILEWTPEERTVVVYESLVPTMESIEDTSINVLCACALGLLLRGRKTMNAAVMFLPTSNDPRRF
uniref:Uncharacterized protein n=1 Tax=Acrobeloides nanus TaxID=290746 RepID=A0A914C653_9BILA